MTRFAQLALVAAALASWAASRVVWVDLTSFDGLGHPRSTSLTGADWSTALVPLALLVLAAAVAVLAVRGWPLRALAVLLACSSAGTGYLGIGFWVVRDVAPRAAHLAEVPIADLVGSERHYLGAGLCVGAAVATLVGAVLVMRASTKERSGAATKYAAPAARRAAASAEPPHGELSERMMWDALDEGRDPTSEQVNESKVGDGGDAVRGGTREGEGR